MESRNRVIGTRRDTVSAGRKSPLSISACEVSTISNRGTNGRIIYYSEFIIVGILTLKEYYRENIRPKPAQKDRSRNLQISRVGPIGEVCPESVRATTERSGVRVPYEVGCALGHAVAGPPCENKA